MNKKLKKKFVALLLFVCCVFGGWLLLTASTTPDKRLKSLDQLDSLIVASLREFHFSSSEIEKIKIKVDSAFHRKKFKVTVLPNFPETKLHLALKKSLRQFDVRVPASVLFPDKDLRVNVSFMNTVVRTLLINVEDPDSSMVHSNSYADS